MKKSVITSAVVIALTATALVLFLALHDKTPPESRSNKAGDEVKKQAEEMLSGIKDKGEFLFKEKSLLAQAAVYQKMLELAPNSSDTKTKLSNIYYSIATMAYDIGDIEKAREYFGKTTAIAPDHSDPKDLRKKLK